MPSIVVAHDEQRGQRWRPFDGDRRDIKQIIKDVWDRLQNYVEENYGQKLYCDCKYPSEISKIRPLTQAQLSRNKGCLVDIDAYNKGFDYLQEEVNIIKSLKGKIYPAGISRYMNRLTSIDEYWFQTPIKNENDIEDYLDRLAVIITASKKDPADAEGLYQLIDKIADSIGRHRK